MKKTLVKILTVISCMLVLVSTIVIPSFADETTTETQSEANAFYWSECVPHYRGFNNLYERIQNTETKHLTPYAVYASYIDIDKAAYNSIPKDEFDDNFVAMTDSNLGFGMFGIYVYADNQGANKYKAVAHCSVTYTSKALTDGYSYRLELQHECCDKETFVFEYVIQSKTSTTYQLANWSFAVYSENGTLTQQITENKTDDDGIDTITFFMIVDEECSVYSYDHVMDVGIGDTGVYPSFETYQYDTCIYESAMDSGYTSGYMQGETAGYNNGYDIGYAYGESDGYDTGYNEGLNEGYTNGYDEGYIDGNVVGSEAGYSSGYNKGLNEGYTNGYDEGYIDGNAIGSEAGYSSGYDVGYSTGKSVGYDDGWYVGFDEGYGEGEVVGYNTGYDHGYEDGYTEGEYAGINGADSYYNDYWSAYYNSEGYGNAVERAIESENSDPVTAFFTSMWNGIIDFYNMVTQNVSVGGISLAMVITTLVIAFILVWFISKVK